jgi:GPN-loop GTPase
MESSCVLVLGMAGSGKSTFMNQLLIQSSNWNKQNAFSINLDPAVYQVPYQSNIDIKKYVDYKKVMKDHGLG